MDVNNNRKLYENDVGRLNILEVIFIDKHCEYP